MAGYARITTDKLHIWVRFERVGRGSKFNILLDAFRASFPLADWDEYHKAWRLPKEQFAKVMKFCNHNFGAGNVHIQEYDSIVSSLRQLSLL